MGRVCLAKHSMAKDNTTKYAITKAATTKDNITKDTTIKESSTKATTMKDDTTTHSMAPCDLDSTTITGLGHHHPSPSPWAVLETATVASSILALRPYPPGQGHLAIRVRNILSMGAGFLEHLVVLMAGRGADSK